MIEPTPAELQRREQVLESIVEHVQAGLTIRLPVRIDEVSRFEGTVGPYRYQFEGEEDLLHLIVERIDKSAIRVVEGQDVAEFLMPKVDSALVWLKPGRHSQHFYVAHDDLVASLIG